MGNFFVALLLLLACGAGNGYVWERWGSPYAKLQRIPRASQTARRLLRDFIGYRRVSDASSGPSVRQNVVFLLDSSYSIGAYGFKRQIYAVRTMVRNCPPNTRFAAIGFSTRAYVSFNFTRAAEAEKRLQKMRFVGKKTNTQEALRLAGELFLGVRDSGRHVINKVLLITDGLSNTEEELTLYRGFQLKQMGVQVFVIAMGRRVYGMPEVIGLVSSVRRHLFRVRDLSQLLRITWRMEARLRSH